MLNLKKNLKFSQNIQNHKAGSSTEEQTNSSDESYKSAELTNKSTSSASSSKSVSSDSSYKSVFTALNDTPSKLSSIDETSHVSFEDFTKSWCYKYEEKYYQFLI